MNSKEVKALKALLLHVRDTHNPKFELNRILVEENKLVCTDTKQLLVLEFKDKFLKQEPEHTIMLCEQIYSKEYNATKRPAELLEMLDANNGFLDELGLKICVPCNETRGKVREENGEMKEYVSHSYAKFPDYKRILIKDIDRVKKEALNTSDALLADYIFQKAVMLNQGFFQTKIFLKFLQLLSKCGKIKNAHIKQGKDEPLMPLMLECDILTSAGSIEAMGEVISVKYLIMPFAA